LPRRCGINQIFHTGVERKLLDVKEEQKLNGETEPGTALDFTWQTIQNKDTNWDCIANTTDVLSRKYF
jgi:hypothetical protein